MESRVMTVQEAHALVGGANNASGKANQSVDTSRKDLANLAKDFQQLLAVKQESFSHMQQQLMAMPAEARGQQEADFGQGIKTELKSEASLAAIANEVKSEQALQHKQAIETNSKATVSVRQLLYLSGEQDSSGDFSTVTQDSHADLGLLTAPFGSFEKTSATSVLPMTATERTASHEMEALVMQQAQRLMVNSPHSVLDTTTDVAIQLKDQVLPGTTLNIKQAVDGGWHIAAQCQSSEIAEILRRAMPQLQSRFKLKDLGEVRLFESVDVDRSDDK